METNLTLKQRSTDLIATVNDSAKLVKFEGWLNIRVIIDQALPICELKRNLEPGDVERSIDIALTRLNESLNLKWKLNSGQIEMCVNDLVAKYPNETVEDFILIFRKARQGEFGEIYRLDSAVIFGWMEYYLEEKYTIWEKQLENEKEGYYKLPDKVADVDRLAQWRASIEAIKVHKAILPLTEREMMEEGQEKPKKATMHPSTSPQEVLKRERHIEWIKANFNARTGDKLPTWQDEETWSLTNQ